MEKNNFPDEQQISISEFREFLFSPIVPIHDIKDHNGELISTLFPYWRRNGLLPFIPKGKWNVEISFSQLIWLRILDTFREFSVPLACTQKMCDYFFKDAYDHDLPEKNLKATKATIEKRITAGTSSEEDEILLIDINRMFGDKLLLYGLKFEINYLTKLITESLAQEIDTGFLVFVNGDVKEYIGNEYFSHRQKEIDLTNPHIRLSIKYYLKEFIKKEELQKLFVPITLNANEKEVLKALRKNNTSITIKKKGGEIIKIESTIEGTISDDKAKEIREILGIRNYEEITISTRNDKELTFKKTKKNNRHR